MQIVKMRITGTSAILMHNPASMRPAETTGTRGGKKIPSAYDEAKTSLYIGPTDQLFVKTEAFREAALIAAKDMRDPTRKGRATMTRRVSAAVFMANEMCLLERQDGTPITSDDDDWEIDTRRVVIQGQGILRSRAKITNWACDLEFEYDEDLIDPALIVAIVAQAGKYPGILDYRVGKKGPFGRFTAELIVEQPKRQRPNGQREVSRVKRHRVVEAHR
jgi:hypothetical protein